MTNEKDRKRQSHKDKERDKETEKEKETESQRQRERDRKRDRERQREREREIKYYSLKQLNARLALGQLGIQSSVYSEQVERSVAAGSQLISLT